MIINLVQKTVGESGPKLPPIGQALESYSWADIDAISEAGKAAEYFLIGDKKTITINNNEHEVEIVGFNHDNLVSGGKAGITFGLVNPYTSAHLDTDGAAYKKGWKDMDRRSALNNNTIGAMPNDLVDVIKPVLKTTAASSSSSTIETTEDRLFLFSEIEVMGSAKNSYSGEGSHYAKFSTAASRKKSTNWWMRSPRKGQSYFMYYNNEENSMYFTFAESRMGLAFGFCV